MISDRDRKSHHVSDEGLRRPASEIAQSELEERAITAIHCHREHIASAEIARLKWAASIKHGNSNIATQYRKAYDELDTQRRAQQLVLNHLINQLGFIPNLRRGSAHAK